MTSRPESIPSQLLTAAGLLLLMLVSFPPLYLIADWLRSA